VRTPALEILTLDGARPDMVVSWRRPSALSSAGEMPEGVHIEWRGSSSIKPVPPNAAFVFPRGDRADFVILYLTYKQGFADAA